LGGKPPSTFTGESRLEIAFEACGSAAALDHDQIVVLALKARSETLRLFRRATKPALVSAIGLSAEASISGARRAVRTRGMNSDHRDHAPGNGASCSCRGAPFEEISGIA
jgi:hypothetical protein